MCVIFTIVDPISNDGRSVARAHQEIPSLVNAISSQRTLCSGKRIYRLDVLVEQQGFTDVLNLRNGALEVKRLGQNNLEDLCRESASSITAMIHKHA